MNFKSNIWIIPFFILSHSFAQSGSYAGEYYLTGVMETASGFRLNTDSSFDFFYSYGALDRSGKGSWSVQDSFIVLKSEGPTPDGFVLKNSRKVKSDVLSIIIDDPNPFFKKYVHGFVSGKEREEEQQSDHDGILRFQAGAYDSLLMMMEFSSEKVFRFPLVGKEENEFTFTFNPTILEVFFRNHRLKIDSAGLRGKHPLLGEKDYFFEKAQ
ncbi:MAG: hypothetical protein IPP38_09210 [Bacteroidetes bacterium]|nr:hypothetical protein [Bacteroidota bacterium]